MAIGLEIASPGPGDCRKSTCTISSKSHLHQDDASVSTEIMGSFDDLSPRGGHEVLSPLRDNSPKDARIAKKDGTCIPLANLDPLPQRMWEEPSADIFAVRGKNYIHDKKKNPSGPSLFRLMAVDIVSAKDCLAEESICRHPLERVQRALAREEEYGPLQSEMPPFVFCVNMALPGPPHYNMLTYFAVDDMSIIDGTSGTPQSRLANNFFFGNSDEFRDSTFKLIPRIVEGNFIVKKAVRSKPVIMGTKLKQQYHRSERFFELVLDVSSDPVASRITQLCTGYAKTLVVDIGFLLEAKDECTLPEQMLGCCRYKNVDLASGARLLERTREE